MRCLRRLAFVLLGSAALSAAVADAPPPTRGTRPLVFGVNRVGDAGVLFDPPDYAEHMLRRIREAGGTLVRIPASPRDVEPERGRRNWEAFDRDLSLALRCGLEPLVLVCNTPAWASPTGRATHEHPYKAELLPDFASFCAELAHRTRGRVRYFQLWNEPNGCGWHFLDGFNHADEYLPMLLVGGRALKQGNPQAVVLLGGLDDAEGQAPAFLTALYDERARRFPGRRLFDGIADHPYGGDSNAIRGKLDALREVLKRNGDGAAPVWITEYGWHGEKTPERERAKKVGEALARFVGPEWSFLEGAIYVSIADVEGGATGFGLCDANLRPRPAYDAFQAASRFGAYPASSLRWRPLAGEWAELAWRTLEPTTGTVTLKPAPAAPVPRASSLQPSHKVRIGGLAPGTDYEVVVTTRSADGRTIDSAPRRVRSAGREIFNGGFEEGFFAGIANEWTIDGAGFCTDAVLIPDFAPHGGRHAQAMMARRGVGLDSTARAAVAADPRQSLTLLVWYAGESRDCGAAVRVRIGLDRVGGDDPGADSVVWSEWADAARDWRQLRVQAKAEAPVVAVLVQARAEGDAGGGLAFAAIDDVVLAPGDR